MRGEAWEGWEGHSLSSAKNFLLKILYSPNSVIILSNKWDPLDNDADAVTPECYTCRSVPTSLGCSFSDYEWDLKEDIQCGDILGEGKER